MFTVFLDANGVGSIEVLMTFLVLYFALCSKFWGLGLTSNYEEGGGESSVTDVVSCQCLMDCYFEFCFSRWF